MADARRAALWLDFDNVFAALAALDEWAAWDFATEPGRWLAWLAGGAGGDAPRRILLRRCYLNPAGWTEPAPGGSLSNWLGQPRIYYSRFRAEFVRAGFQVVDCPRLARLKNAADIVMALDAADALAHPTRFDEFLILSGDSDFTPLLHRLRAHDRLTLLVTQASAAQALRAAADAVIALEEFAEAGLPETKADAAPAAAPQAAAALAPTTPAAAVEPVADPVPDPGEPAAQRAAILAALREELSAAPGPLHLPALGIRIHRVCGGWVRRSRFGGAGTLAKLIEGAEGVALEAGPGGGWVYDPARHERPSVAGGAEQPDIPADPMEPLRLRLDEHMDLPRLTAAGLDFVLRRLAAMLPLANPLAPEVRGTVSAEASATGLDVSGRKVNTIVLWLQRGRFDWRAEPDAEAHLRMRRVLFATMTHALAAAGRPAQPAEAAVLREWVGLGEEQATPAPAGSIREEEPAPYPSVIGRDPVP